VLVEVLHDGEPVLAELVVVVGFRGEFVEDAEHGLALPEEQYGYHIHRMRSVRYIPSDTLCLGNSVREKVSKLDSGDTYVY
jgi:hypothetical protein